MPAWLIASLAANVCINIVEYVNRTGNFASPIDAFKVTAPFIVAAQFGLFYAWQGAPSMMTAWAAFTVANSALRLASNHWLVGEPLSVQGWIGCSIMFIGMVVVKEAK
jgi:multidrug transporter EmrE-like cation transporter